MPTIMRIYVLLLCSLNAWATTYMHPPPSIQVANIWRDGPCAPRAWVRAEDLRQGAISHGELRVQLVQPCTPSDVGVVGVGLVLKLDEFLEKTGMVTPELALTIPSWKWHRTQQSDWTTHKINQTTFASDAILATGAHNVADIFSTSGLVLPFSVAMPDTPFPAGIFPLSSNAQIDDYMLMQMTFGRAYRYIATIQYSNGSSEHTAAGYTTFVPRHVSVPDEKAQQESITVDASIRSSKDDDDGVYECNPSPSPQTLAINASFPHGMRVVPGEDIDIELSILGAEENAQMTIDLVLATEVVLNDGTSHQTFFRELQTGPSPFDDLRTRCNPPCRTKLSIPPNFPSHGADGALFKVAAALTVYVSRLLDAKTYPPEALGTTGDFLPEDFEVEWWAFGSTCDQPWHHRQHFTARIPLVLPSVTGYTEQLDKGSLAPRVLPGHVPEGEVDVVFPRVMPAIVEDETMGTRTLEGFSWPVNDILGFVGQYVGPLWERRKARAARIAEQVVLVAHA